MDKRISRQTIFCVLGLLVAGLSSTAIAQDEDDWTQWPMGKRFTISAAAFFANLDTKVQVDASNGIVGTRIDFEQDLGMQDTRSMPAFQAEWRFARKHQLALGYFELNRSGSEITETTIRIGDIVFDANLPVSSYFDVSTLSLSYQYSLIFDAKKELAIGIGIAMEDISFALSGNNGPGLIEEQSDTSVPLPTFNISGGYAFTDKWSIRVGVGILAVELDLGGEDDFTGEIFQLGVVAYHQTFEHIRFGVGYSLFDLDVSLNKQGKFTAIRYNYHGPQLTVGGTF